MGDKSVMVQIIQVNTTASRSAGFRIDDTMTHDPQQIPVKVFPIRLGQFLKHANLVQDGFEAKIVIQNGEVTVNGAQETRRGKQLSAGDIIGFAGYCVQVSTE